MAGFAAGSRRHPVDPRDVAEIERHLRRLLIRLDAGPVGDPSPRIHAGRLIREIASRRLSLSRCRREEQEPALRLVLADVSGSCSAACRETVAAAQALVESDPVTYAAVAHSNGYPVEVLGLAAAPPTIYTAEDDPRWWERALAGRRLAGVIAFGDSDALWLYGRLAARAPIVWLDSHSARAGLRRAPCRALGELPFAPRVWWWGVNDAARAAIALRGTARRDPAA
jgi:hypothetical protein